MGFTIIGMFHIVSWILQWIFTIRQSLKHIETFWILLSWDLLSLGCSIYFHYIYIYIYIYIQYHIDWLVVWNMNFMTFHKIWDVILPYPSHWLIFFRGVETTKQSIYIYIHTYIHNIDVSECWPQIRKKSTGKVNPGLIIHGLLIRGVVPK